MRTSDIRDDVGALTPQDVGYVPRRSASPSLYRDLGFRCGLEVHQQLKTHKKLFCRCPAGRYQPPDSYDAQLVRHMRPTLSELGEYDGTALMEFKTRKNIVYRIKGETACTYDIDDTPPFPINRKALEIAIEIALLLGTQIVGELHITRKQYLDGSIPTGFQRTAIVGIQGEIPLSEKNVGIIQLSIEEDSCREVSDIGHVRTYTTDRLGMPLVETVTGPELLSPDEAAEAAQIIRFITRSTGKVNVGIGAAREDVNVSITGGTRVEIKGVQHIRWIPELTHNEAFRQKALLMLRDRLLQQVADVEAWQLTVRVLPPDHAAYALSFVPDSTQVIAVNLPGFAGALSSFTNPNRCFADEISDRIAVVACIGKPNCLSSEAAPPEVPSQIWEDVRARLEATPRDAQLLVWGAEDDLSTALETIEERCQWAFAGVPNETRKALSDGTTVFERVLPGPDRMYPDTDSAPIPIHEPDIQRIAEQLPSGIADRQEKLETWRVPADCRTFLLKRNLFPVLERLIEDVALDPVFASTLLGHTLRGACAGEPGDARWLLDLARAVDKRDLQGEILRELVPAAWLDPSADLDALLVRVGYTPMSEAALVDRLASLAAQFSRRGSRTSKDALRHWLLGQMRREALGNVSMARLAERVRNEVDGS